MLTIREFAPHFLELAHGRQAPRTYHETARLTRILVECLGDVPVGSLTPLHVQALHQQIGVLEGAPIQANRLRSVVSQLCAAAELHGLRALGRHMVRTALLGVGPRAQRAAAAALTYARLEARRLGVGEEEV